MSSTTQPTVDELMVLENIAKWQAVQDPLTPLTDKQLDIMYKIEDKINETYYNNAIPKVQSAESLIIDNLTNYCQWFSKAENDMKQQNLRQYTGYAEQLHEYDNLCKEICDNTDQVLSSLKDLQVKYQNVSTKTNSLHSLSDQLMKDGKVLKDKKALVADKLRHFWAYNQLQKQLDKLANDVNSEKFVLMLSQMDVSLAFFSEQKRLKEGTSYRYRFESLLTQACQYVVRNFGAIVREATAQAQATPGGSTEVLHAHSGSAASFYYGNFQNAASKIAKVLNHIEIRASNRHHIDIYNRALNECQRTYFNLRSPMITTAVRKALLDLRDKHRTDQSLLFRSSGFFVMKVCEDEATCFRYFFADSTPQLSDYLGSICEILYDVLRPTLITINHLEVLTELCTSLKEMLNDHVRNNDALQQFVIIANQLLHDVEERLVFRTNVFFQHDIRLYNPSPGDLAYPEKLEQMENIMEDIVADITDGELSEFGQRSGPELRSFTGNSVADLHGMWYPSVKRTLVCLSRLYLCLEREVFQGLAQEALLVCVESLDRAGSLVAARRPSDGLVHGHLFQVKHLLILREQIAPFQVEFIVRETGLDWAGILHTGDRLFRQGGKNALLEFLLEGTVPQVKEYLVDSRKEIDLQLKRTCEAFIAVATARVLTPIHQWLEQAETLLLANTNVKFKEEANGQPKSLGALITATQRTIKTQIPVIQKTMRTYLSNKETEFILFRPIKNNILLAFLRVEQVMKKAKYTEEERTVAASPSAEVLNVLISSVSLNTDYNSGRLRSTSQSSNVSTSTSTSAIPHANNT